MDPRKGRHILEEAGEIGGGLNRTGVELHGQIFVLVEYIATLKKMSAVLKQMRDAITEDDDNEGEMLFTIGNTLIPLKKSITALKTQKSMVHLANTNLLEATRLFDKFSSKVTGILKS